MRRILTISLVLMISLLIPGPRMLSGQVRTPHARMTQAEAIAALRAFLAKRVRADQFSGAVLITKNGKPIFEYVYGFANRERKIPNTIDTKFRNGSMDKMFTAVAIAQLAQAGKLKFTDPLIKYLPNYPNRKLATEVTIHDLLTHTGGTGDIFGPEFDAHRDQLRTLQDYENLYGKRALLFKPGTKWQYSNYGFILLGLVIQHVTGESYYKYARQHIFKPAGMTSTGLLPENVAVPGRSVGYMKMAGYTDRVNRNTWRPNTDTLPWRGTSAGGGYSTVKDFVAFANALLAHKLLDAHYTEIVTTAKVATTMPGGGQYAYGFMVDGSDGAPWFGHGGGAPGMNGMLQIYPRSGYIISVLANLDPPAAQDVAKFIGDRLPAQ